MQKVLLVGNPNTGKTTLFNTITKAGEHASNWHGVTVDVKEKTFKYNKKEFVLCDLPGIYSLDGLTKEEEIASDFIEKNKDAIIICLLDANNLRRNLFLAFDIIKKTKNVILAVNMAKEVPSFSAERLSREINIPVFGIDARKTKSVQKLLQQVARFSEENKEMRSNGNKINGEKNKDFSLRGFEQRSISLFKEIDNVLDNSGYNPTGFYGYGKADKILLNGFWSPIIFVFVIALVFFITFGFLGNFISNLIIGLFDFCFSGILSWFSTFITSEPLLAFLEQGVFGGALTIVGFMPQIILMFLCLNFLEDVGYFSRVAVVFDNLFKKLGLTGRSAFSLIMGFGCTTSAVMTTRNLESKKARERTGLLLPFMSCSAKLPIFAVICSAFFDKYKAIIVFGLYLLGIVIMILVSLVIEKFSKHKKQEVFLLELPKYRLPSVKKVFKGTLETAKSFLVRVGGVLLLSSMVVFLLNNFALDFSYVAKSSKLSILEAVSSKLSFLFIPLGFGVSGVVVALISGLIAKEMVVSSLAIINGVQIGALAESLTFSGSAVHFNILSGLSFLVFVLLYSPCLSALIAMKKEYGTKFAIKSFFLQFGVAYFISFIVYNLGLLFMHIWWLAVLVLILLALCFVLVLKLKCKKKILCVCDNCSSKSCDIF